MIYGKERRECIEQLRRGRFYPVKFTAIYWERGGLSPQGGSISYAEMSVFCKQISALLQAGIAVPQALRFLMAQKISRKLQSIITELVQALEEGESLFQGFNRHKTKLPPFFCSLVKAGEMTNTLETVFERLASFYEEEDQFRKQINQLMAYPLILILCTAGVICFLVLKIIPGFQEIYASFDTKLPVVTYCLLAISKHFTLNLKKYLIGFFIMAFSLSRMFKAQAIKQWIIHMQYQLPFWGNLQKKLLSARLARTWSLLLASGLEVLPVVEMTVGTSGILVDAYLQQVAARLKQGVTLTRSLKMARFFPDIFLEMVNVGEESGSLAGMLGRVAEIYEREGKNQIAKFLTILEPSLLIGISLIVGVIVLAVMLPMFDMVKLF